MSELVNRISTVDAPVEGAADRGGELLTELGKPALTAANGAEAVDIANRGGLLAIVMDLDIPVMGGLDATRSLPGRASRVPVLAHSGRCTADDTEQCLAAGMDATLRKDDVHSIIQYLERLVPGEAP